MMAALRLRWQQRPAAALAEDAALARDWNRLNSARGDLPFLTAEAVACAIDGLGSGSERLFLGHDGSMLVAAFVLVRSGLGQWQTFQPSQLPLGAWVADAQLALADLADSLARHGPATLLMLSITRIDPLAAAREPAGASATEAGARRQRHDDYIDTAWVSLDGTLDSYWAARGKNLRQNMRKQRNKLAAEGVAAQLHTLTQTAEMPGAIARYGQLESTGWKGSEGSAIHADNAQGCFYRRLFEGAAERGEAVVYEYWFGERCVASNLCLQRGGTLVMLKTAYDESIKSYSPAFLLHQDIVEALFESRAAHRIEYFGKVMDWHTKWTTDKRSLYHLTTYRFAWLKAAAEAWRRQASRQRLPKADAAAAAVPPAQVATAATAATPARHELQA